MVKASADGGLKVKTSDQPDNEYSVRGSTWDVMKYGGSCMATAQRIGQAADYICNIAKNQKQLVVVSAMGKGPQADTKVTDLLIRMVQRASSSDEQFLLDLNEIQKKHIDTAEALLGKGPTLMKFMDSLMDDIQDLKAMLRAISIAGMATEQFTDFVVGHGELWCAQLTAAAVSARGTPSQFMDTREVLVVRPTNDENAVDVCYDESNAKLDKWFVGKGEPSVIVATGFIARNEQGQATTLKRNGSDYSATILGRLMEVQQITIWTDVDGVYSADPRKVTEAVCLKQLTYHEAWELSYFGANVLHPRTTLPAMSLEIPIVIRNFFNLDAQGTEICGSDPTSSPFGRQSVKGFATIDNVSLINVEGTGMVGVPGTASSIFTAIRTANINVIMISQASSEHSVCFAVKQADSQAAVSALRKSLSSDIQSGGISKVESIDECSVLAAVGERMSSNKGVSATMFSALAQSNVNIKAIAQGCSEYNITTLISQADSIRALRSVHACFYLSDVAIGIGLIGPGLIGGTLLKQIEIEQKKLKQEMNIDLRVLGIVGSKKMALSEKGIQLDKWEDHYQNHSIPADLGALGAHLASSYIPNTVVIDATASDQPAEFYQKYMENGIHVITPNKKLGSGDLDRYLAVRKLGRQSYVHWFYEATVGAGLPVIGTLRHLVETGDRVLKIEGIFSGTLSYIFNTLNEYMTFSDVVATAKEQGFTEPDPRDDLNGMDVARKVCILARECGLSLGLSDVPVHSLVPKELENVDSVDDFMAQLPNYDDDIKQQVEEAKKNGEVLRYVGVVDCENGGGSVALKAYPTSHPFTQLSGADNIISFTTSRYKSCPLIIRGPGAGADVTAGGVFSDLLKLAAYLGAPS